MGERCEETHRAGERRRVRDSQKPLGKAALTAGAGPGWVLTRTHTGKARWLVPPGPTTPWEAVPTAVGYGNYEVDVGADPW